MTVSDCRISNSRRWLDAIVCLTIMLVLSAFVSSTTGCAAKNKEAVGDENYNASLALISYETIDGEFEGIIYREVNSFSLLIARADVPVLTVFYNPMSDLNTLMLPMLEEMSIQYDQQLMIVLADVEKQSALAEEFSVKTLPQFSIVKQASLKRSLIGFDDDTPDKLNDLVEAYIG